MGFQQPIRMRQRRRHRTTNRRVSVKVVGEYLIADLQIRNRCVPTVRQRYQRGSTERVRDTHRIQQVRVINRV